ncbi:MAG TPA: endolytic transglycosylase MltG [Blastocatellia bacterium]|nr:endolytic transglycosylase MltG [Blastocatellia bacterium]
MGRGRVFGILTTAIVVLFMVAAVGGWFQVALTSRHDLPAEGAQVTVLPGMSTREIVGQLARSGIVSDETAVLLWLTLTGKGRSLKAGDYEFQSPISPVEAIDKIRKGEVAARRVTIPEGMNRFEVAATLAEKTGLAPAERFVELTADPALINDLDPEATSLEGYLFPDTYVFTPKTTPEELVDTMVSRFRSIYSSRPEFSQYASMRHMTLHEVITLASMVEEEARLDDERPVIASVFSNRLAKGMKLASDPTFVYAAQLAGDYDGNVNNPRHRVRNSPYNTYLVEGLPPGPIANPGMKSIEAALQPADTDYLYFVVNGTEGRHKFSRTVEEHERAVAEYRRQQHDEGAR